MNKISSQIIPHGPLFRILCTTLAAWAVMPLSVEGTCTWRSVTGGEMWWFNPASPLKGFQGGWWSSCPTDIPVTWFATATVRATSFVAPNTVRYLTDDFGGDHLSFTFPGLSSELLQPQTTYFVSIVPYPFLKSSFHQEWTLAASSHSSFPFSSQFSFFNDPATLTTTVPL